MPRDRFPLTTGSRKLIHTVGVRYGWLETGGEGKRGMDGLRAVANREVTKVTLEGVPDRPGIAAEIFGALGQQGFNIELVVSTGGSHGTAEISLAITRSQEVAVIRALESIRRDVGARGLYRDSTVALVSLTGSCLSNEPGIAGRMFGAISRNGVNIEVISTSPSSVICMIHERDVPVAMEALRREFDLKD